jgi:hypothetical protein
VSHLKQIRNEYIVRVRRPEDEFMYGKIIVSSITDSRHWYPALAELLILCLELGPLRLVRIKGELLKEKVAALV